MAFKHQMQANRFELKYIIDESKADEIREFIKSYMQEDEFNPPQGGGYAVHSLYLDNPALDLCNATVWGHKNRFKLRIRFYDDKPTDPVFFEIKRRVNDAILKERATVRRSSAARLMAGHWPQHSDLLKYSDKGYSALMHFLDLRNKIQARGQAIVSYLREAYVVPDSDAVRVTFDRHLRTLKYNGALTVSDRTDWIHPPMQGIVLEIKFTDRFPDWVRNMARSFELMRGSMPKYVTCVHSIGSDRRHDRAVREGVFR